jgi:phosphoribosylamine--glycine ligase
LEKKNVLVIGSGGREHAMADSLKNSPHVGTVYAAPGNGGMTNVAEIVSLDITNSSAVIQFIKDNQIDLTVIGPEAPLVAGLSDAIRESGFLVVGASQKAAQLEGSKVFAKTFMSKYGIPTAAYKMFENAEEAKAFVRTPEARHYKVIKADGLAAGKGVVVASTTEDVLKAISEIMEEKKFGSAGSKIILEETLKGPEVSIMALTDGKTVLPFPSSQDHKRVFDSDKGPNTGGMGAYAPTPFYDDAARVIVEREISQNFIRGLKSEGLDFRGIIYFGIMLTKNGPKVLEFNVRLGDPEAEVVLPLIKSDMYEVFKAVAEGNLSQVNLQIRPGSACTVVMASGGYPGSFKTGFIISGLDRINRKGQVFVYHAGTRKEGEIFLTNGGRVLTVTALGRTLDNAVVRAYQGVKKIAFSKAHFRNDIAAKALINKKISNRIHKMKIRYKKEVALINS